MEQLKQEAERAEREGDYGKVAEIRYGKLKQLTDDINVIQQQLHQAQGAMAMVREEVTADDIAEVVSRWTGIPVTRMMQSEREKLLHLEEELHKRVIGQEEAIRAVSDDGAADDQHGQHLVEEAEASSSVPPVGMSASCHVHDSQFHSLSTRTASAPRARRSPAMSS